MEKVLEDSTKSQVKIKTERADSTLDVTKQSGLPFFVDRTGSSDGFNTFDVADRAASGSSTAFDVADKAASGSSTAFDLADKAASGSSTAFDVAEKTAIGSSTAFDVADKAASGSSTAFDVADKAASVSSFTLDVTDKVKSNGSVPEATLSARQRRKRRKKRCQTGHGDSNSSNQIISEMIDSAKRRVFDQLKQLASIEDKLAANQSKDSTVATTSASRELQFLQSINDQLEAAIVKGGRRLEGDVNHDEANEAESAADTEHGGITLGVKATAHHAPAFNRVHRRDLAEFLVEMRPDKDLWRIDPVDLQPRQQRVSNPSVVADATPQPAQPAQCSVDPMQIECSICLKRGHLTEACTRTGPVCILCGREGHAKTGCPERLCPLCLAVGHEAKACHRYGLLSREPCVRCGAVGHWKDQCPEIWRQYHSTVSPGLAPIQSPRQASPHMQQFSGLPASDGAAAAAAAVKDDDAASSDSVEVESVQDIVGQVSPFPFCCNCGQRGHLVDRCSQPRSLLNKFVGSFHSQLVRQYDSADRFSPQQKRPAKTAAAAAAAAAVPGTSGGSATTSNVSSNETEAAAATSAAAAQASESSDTPTWSSRPGPRIGDEFIPLSPPQRRGGRPSFRAELDQLRAMASRLLPEGASRSQIKKLANRLGYWRRHGYQPSTPEQEVQMAHRMEAWVLDVADAHNQLHRLNFKRRCRLLNSTGATLEVIRSCRQFAEPSPAAAVSRKRQEKPTQPEVAAESPTSTPAKQEEPAIWSGRLRSRSSCLATPESRPKADQKKLAKKRTK